MTNLKARRVTRQTVEYDPEYTARGTKRKRYSAPTTAQKKLRERKQMMSEQEARNLSAKVKVAKRPEEEELFRKHIWLTKAQIEWISRRAFREGIKKSEWVRRVLDAVRLADVGVLNAEGEEQQ